MNQVAGRIDKFGNILHPDVVVQPPSPPEPTPVDNQTPSAESQPVTQEK